MCRWARFFFGNQSRHDSLLPCRLPGKLNSVAPWLSGPARRIWRQEFAMFSIHDQSPRLCDGITRREWLRVGGLGLGGISLPGLLHARTVAPVGNEKSFGRAKRCIVFF